MRVGPLSMVHFEKLKSLLDAGGAVYQVAYDAENLERSRQELADKPFNPYPTYTALGDFIYLDIELKDALLIRGEAEKMGLSIGSRERLPEDEKQEFLCPKCDHCAEEPGLCPRHRVPLLEFSDWVAARQQRRFFSRENFVAVFVLLLFLLVTAIAYLLRKGP